MTTVPLLFDYSSTTCGSPVRDIETIWVLVNAVEVELQGEDRHNAKTTLNRQVSSGKDAVSSKQQAASSEQ